uniref:Ig-like domain-containing protein n=1 Tax=Biomphalaria glabrata TaxID=6526 RepID=A0A2C9LPT0_BIOGL
MSGQRLLNLWTCAIITLLVQTTTAEVCDKPTSQVTPRTSQLTASSTASGLSVDYGVYDCCNTLSLGGWCHVTNRSDEWYDVRFTSAVNVTVVVLQQPYIAAGASPPTVTQFRLLYEDARDQFDVLTKYTYKNNGTDQEVIDAVYSNGQFILNLSTPVIARRIRIIVVNYTDRPCMRLDIRGCPVDMAPPDSSIPKVRFDPASSSGDLRLLCSASNLSYFAVDYLVTWYRNTEKVLEEKLTNDAVTSYLNVTADNFSSRQTHKCHVQACYQAFCSINATYSNGNSSHVYIPDIEITNKESLVLREGETTYVKVHATAPPYLLCTTAGQQLDCDITIVATSYDDNATM